MQAADKASRAAELAWYFETFPRFASLLDINTKAGERKPFAFNDIQRKYLANATQRDVILKPRTIGMSTLLLATAPLAISPRTFGASSGACAPRALS